MKTTVKKNYPYQTAGQTWSVPELRLVSLPDGTVAISEAEIHRIHRAIANEICGNNASLSIAELEFLCDVTGTTFSDVANWLQIHRSTVTRWRKSGKVPKSVMSLVLKKWFWFLLFGESLHDEAIPLNCAVNETQFLSFAKQETIDKHLADPISQAKISTL